MSSLTGYICAVGDQLEVKECDVIKLATFLRVMLSNSLQGLRGREVRWTKEMSPGQVVSLALGEQPCWMSAVTTPGVFWGLGELLSQPYD